MLAKISAAPKKRPLKRHASPLLALLFGAILLGALASSPWLISVFTVQKPVPRKAPPVPKKPPVGNSSKAAADLKLLQNALDQFDGNERTRQVKLEQAGKQLSRAKGVAFAKLHREAEQIALRMATPTFAARLGAAKVRAQLPGDESAADKVIVNAIGPETAATQRLFKKQARNLVGQFSGGPTALGPQTVRQAQADQLWMGKFIVRQASRDMGRFAKGSSVRILKKAVARLPASTLDGPLPAVELALFSATVWDVYRQGSTARKAAQQSILSSAMQANTAKLEAVSKLAHKNFSAHHVFSRGESCAKLKLSYRRTMVGHLRSAVTERCGGV